MMPTKKAPHGTQGRRKDHHHGLCGEFDLWKRKARQTVDKNGEIPFLTNLIGAAVGAGVEYIGQVATNILTDQKIQFSDFTNIDIADIGIAAGEGFITSGGSAVRNAFAKVAVSVGTEVLQNAVDINTSSKERVSLKIHNTTEFVSNTAIGLLGGEIKK